MQWQLHQHALAEVAHGGHKQGAASQAGVPHDFGNVFVFETQCVGLMQGGTASLEVNGIKKPVSIAYVEKGSEILAKFKINASDFSLPKAEYLGVGVDNTVVVEATLSFKAR